MSVSNLWQNALLQTSKANASLQVPSATELFTDSPKNFISPNLFTSVQLIYSKDYPLSSTTPSTLSILPNSMSNTRNSRKASSSSSSVTTLYHSQTSSHQAPSRWNRVSISISALHQVESSAGSTERHFEESHPPHTSILLSQSKSLSPSSQLTSEFGSSSLP